MDHSEIQAQGYNAYFSGGGNPYEKGTNEFLSYEQGWMDAHEDSAYEDELDEEDNFYDDCDWDDEDFDDDFEDEFLD